MASKHLILVLSIFLSSSWGFCILLMDSAYNYDAKNDAKVSSQQLLPFTTKSMILCPSFNFVEYIKLLQEKPQLGFCSTTSDENTETNYSNNVIEVESESPTEPLDRLDEALVTSSQSAVVDTTESNDHAPTMVDNIEEPNEQIEEQDNFADDSQDPPIEDATRYIVKAVPMSATKLVENVEIILEETKTEIPEQELPVKEENQPERVIEKPSTNDTLPESSVVIASNDTVLADEHIKDTIGIVETPIGTQSSSNKTTLETPDKTEPPIREFAEFREKALEEEQKKKDEEKRKRAEDKKLKQNHQNLMNNVDQGGTENKTSEAAPHPNRMKKNFASLDCGAKVAGANPEAQSASNIITPSRDEYMLNKCSDQGMDGWFVVELCAEMQAFKIELANFELYSSGPKDFRVSMSYNFHGRENGWNLFGDFRAEDSKDIQTFISPEGQFGKYVKVEIFSHYGNEHYCPVSLFKIFGIDQLELIADIEDPDPQITDDDVDLTENNNNLQIPIDSTEKPSTQNNNNSTIIQLIQEEIERIVGVFTPSMQIKDLDMTQALDQSSLVGNTFLYNVSCPNCDNNRFRDVYYLLASNYAQLLTTLKNNWELNYTLSKHVCDSYGFNTTTTNTTNSDTQQMLHSSGLKMVEFYTTLFGTSRILALCNVVIIESGQKKLANRDLILPSWMRSSNETSASVNPGDHSAPNQIEQNPKMDSIVSATDSSNSTSVDSSVNYDINPVVPNIDKNNHKKEDQNNQNGGSKVEEINTNNPQIKTEDVISPALAPPAEPVNINPTPVHDPASTDQHTSDSSQPNNDHPDVVVVPTHKVSNNNNNGGHGNTGVWQRLSNKIKALELNVSITGRYLEELSVQYKKQIEDLTLAVGQSKDALLTVTKAREDDQVQLKNHQDQISQLKNVVEDVSTRMETMSTWAVTVHIMFLVVEIFVGILFVFACVNLRNSKSSQNSVKLHGNTIDDDEIPVNCSTPIKRRHSHEEKSVYLSDNHIEEIKVSKRRCSLDLNSQKNPQSLNGKLTGSLEGLSKRQKKRLNRRLSKSKENTPEKYIIPSIPENVLMDRSNSESSDWQTVRRSSGIIVNSPSNNINGVARNIELDNMFGFLNNSQHDEEHTVQKVPSSNPMTKKIFFLNGNHITNDSSATTSRSVTPISDCSPFHVKTSGVVNVVGMTGTGKSSKKVGKVKKIRSKSTSPARKLESSKSKKMFKHFNPDRVDWIQNKKPQN